jgi:hypothetical protein
VWHNNKRRHSGGFPGVNAVGTRTTLGVILVNGSGWERSVVHQPLRPASMENVVEVTMALASEAR